MHLRSITLRSESFPTSDHYPFNLAVFREPFTLDLQQPITLFVGENGTGKSTLLEAIARQARIQIWRADDRARFQYNAYEPELHRHLELCWTRDRVVGSFFAGETFRDFARLLDEWARQDPGQLKYFGGSSLLAQSHGQSLLAFFRSRFILEGLYLVDEPETALSPRSQLQLLRLLGDCASRGRAQFVIASHSPIILACPGAKLYSFDGERIGAIAYEKTDHFQLYRSFFEDRSAHV
jgi:predicted ATPase